MVQLGCHPNLAEEPLASQHLGQLGLQYLERDVAIVLQVARQIDHGHSTMADLALDRVPAPEGGRELVLQFGQGGFREGSSLEYHPLLDPARWPKAAARPGLVISSAARNRYSCHWASERKCHAGRSLATLGMTVIMP